jgi:hypothetical protein
MYLYSITEPKRIKCLPILTLSSSVASNYISGFGVSYGCAC